jgi:hypothetical protein
MRDGRQSDQYDNWSDRGHRNSFHPCFAAEKETASGPAASAAGPVAGLSDRALQALRQAGVQVRSRGGPRSQVLPVGEPIGIDTANGLRATRVSAAGGGVLEQLPSGPGHSQRDLCDQPRAVAAAQAAIGGTGEWRGYSDADKLPPRGCGRHCRGQHASVLCSAATTKRAARGAGA